MLVGLLSIFLHSCEIKSASDLGMRLHSRCKQYMCTFFVWQRRLRTPLGWAVPPTSWGRGNPWGCFCWGQFFFPPSACLGLPSQTARAAEADGAMKWQTVTRGESKKTQKMLWISNFWRRSWQSGWIIFLNVRHEIFACILWTCYITCSVCI